MYKDSTTLFNPLKWSWLSVRRPFDAALAILRMAVMGQVLGVFHMQKRWETGGGGPLSAGLPERHSHGRRQRAERWDGGEKARVTHEIIIIDRRDMPWRADCLPRHC